MKKLSIIYLAILLSVLQLAAQVPQGINYQTVVRNGSGAIIPNQNVNFRLSVISGSPTGTIVYVEAHPVATNSLGLVNLIIGQGTPITGTFSNINWGNAAHYLSVELDPAGGNAFQPMGTQQLMSVPYALYAEKSSNTFIAGQGIEITNDTISAKKDTALWNANKLQSNSVSSQAPQQGQVLMWNGNTWQPTTLPNSNNNISNSLIYTTRGF